MCGFADDSTRLCMIGQVNVASGMGAARQLHVAHHTRGSCEVPRSLTMIASWSGMPPPNLPTDHSTIGANYFVMVLSCFTKHATSVRALLVMTHLQHADLLVRLAFKKQHFIWV